jgi:hypothetical protein
MTELHTGLITKITDAARVGATAHARVCVTHETCTRAHGVFVLRISTRHTRSAVGARVPGVTGATAASGGRVVVRQLSTRSDGLEDTPYLQRRHHRLYVVEVGEVEVRPVTTEPVWDLPFRVERSYYCICIPSAIRAIRDRTVAKDELIRIKAHYQAFFWVLK